MILISTKQVQKKGQHSYAHSLLSRCMKESGIDYAEGITPVVFGEHGKPSLAEHPGLHYNISHADGIAAAMVSDCECGIDCELIRTFRPRVMKRSFSESERALVEAAPESERDLLFFSLWTLKEAYIKALGVGLSFPLHEAEFAFEGNNILTDLKGCSFSGYIIDREFAVSVCELSDNRRPNKICYMQTSDNFIVI